MDDMELTECIYCREERDCGDMIYDDRINGYFCDEHCFQEWAEEKLDDVVSYYAMMNIHGL